MTRKELASIINRAEKLKGAIEAQRAKFQSRYDKRTIGWIYSGKGFAMSDKIASLDCVLGNMDDAIEMLKAIEL